MPLRDLTHPLESGMPVYPGGDPVTVEPGFTYEADATRTTEFSLDSHNGTHIDAPSHMAEDGATLAEFPIESFRFDALLIDCTDLTDRDTITADRIPSVPDEVDMLVFRTDWSEHWGSDRYFDHPYLSAEAAQVAATADVAVGLDVMSPDPSPSENQQDGEPEGYPAHDALFAAGKRIIENLRGLDDVPERFSLHAYPLPLGGDGAQIRAVAEV